MKSTVPVCRLMLLLSFLLPLFIQSCNKNRINGVRPQILVTTRVSLSSTQTQGNLDCINDTPGVSNDGRYIAFTSKAFNLVPNDNNNANDVFYRDMVARTTALVSINLSGTGSANAVSGQPWMSGNGQYVVFASRATDLTSDVIPAGTQQIYVRDMIAGKTTLVSRATGIAGNIANQDCFDPKLTNDGTYVVFDTTATNLDPLDDTDAFSDIYRRHWIDGTGTYTTDLITFASGTSSGSANKGNSDSFHPAISSDGRYVAYESHATNLVSLSADGAPKNNGTVLDVYVRDTMTFRTVRCSVPFAGAPEPNPAVDGDSRAACISADGQTVGFRSVAGNLNVTAQETNPNIYIRYWNAATPTTVVCSVHTSGATGGASCDLPQLTADGTKIVWQSLSSALVDGDTNGVMDVFVRDLVALTTTRQSVSTYGFQLNGASGAPNWSANGAYIAFYSEADNVVDDDTNGAADIFERGPPFN